MAVNEPTWSLGKSVLINSNGETTDPAWSLGESFLIHEWEAAAPGGVAPTSVLYGPLVGPMGGPI
jgi:hypothetical protein